MRWFSILAIYFLFWFLCLFPMLSIGHRTTADVGGERVPGQADSAPHVFKPWPIVVRTTIAATVCMGIFYCVYRQGWIDVHMADPQSAAQVTG